MSAVGHAVPPLAETVRARRDRRMLQLVGAVAALLLVAGLIVRGSVGLYHPADERIVTVDPRSGEVVSGDVDLRSAATGPLFDDVHLSPGDVRSECVVIDYRGDVDIDSVILQLSATSGPARLMDALGVTVERGTAGPSGCDSFVSEARFVSGPLAELAAGAGRSRRAGYASWTPSDGERATYRFTVELRDDVTDRIQGDRVTADFRWVARAAPVGNDLAARLGMLLSALARDGIVPLLVLTTVAVLFLGVQDRIDRRDPKLARAPVSDAPRPFVDPAVVTVATGRAAGAGGA